MRVACQRSQHGALLQITAVCLLRDLLGKGDLVRIKRYGDDADQLFRAIENLSQLCASRFECIFLHTVGTSGGASHDICGLIDPVDTIETGLDRRVRQCLGFAPCSNPANILQLQLDGITVVSFKIPRLLDVRFSGGISVDVSV